MQNKFYYRLKPIAIDFSDEGEIKKYNSELASFNSLNNQFTQLKSAFDNATKERADIIINVLPEISGVIELQVFHKIKYKIFSNTVKSNCVSLCVTKFNENGQMDLFFYDTQNFNEVQTIFEEFIENKTVPELSNWKNKLIG